MFLELHSPGTNVPGTFVPMELLLRNESSMGTKVPGMKVPWQQKFREKKVSQYGTFVLRNERAIFQYI